MNNRDRHSPAQAGAVAVYGAYGHTGRFIVAELRRRGWAPILCGRDANKLETMAAALPDIEWRLASVDDPLSLDNALKGTVAVVNAAGPFLETAAPVIEAALRAGVHYFDTSAEQRAAYATFERYGDRVRNAGLVAMPSVAFYGALADLLATAAIGDWPDAEAIDIAVGLDYWHPTPGTRITGERNRWRRWVVEKGQLRVSPDPAPTRTWMFPEPLGRQEMVLLPLSEIIAIAHHLRCEEVHSYMNLAPLRDIRDPHTPPPVAVDDSGRSTQTFTVDVRVYRRGRMRRATAHGKDIYAVSAPLIVEALGRVMAGEVSGTGSLSAGQAFDAKNFLTALSPEHLCFLAGHEEDDDRGKQKSTDIVIGIAAG